MDQLQRFIDLVNKTGDKLVIFDRYQPDNSCVILGINDYERLLSSKDSVLDLTEEELADKINGDIAIWKNEQVLSDFSKDTQDWPDDIDNWSESSSEALSQDSGIDLEPEEELNYLYSEPEPVLAPLATVSDDYAPVSGDDIIAEEPAAPVITTEPSKATKPDFESLGEILGSKYETSNNWSIPSNRKALASDKFAKRYESIGF
jgi:hypothetical protein